jgi:hypothetical protein
MDIFPKTNGYFPKNNYDQIRNENPKIGKPTTSVTSKEGIKLGIKLTVEENGLKRDG